MYVKVSSKCLAHQSKWVSGSRKLLKSKRHLNKVLFSTIPDNNNKGETEVGLKRHMGLLAAVNVILNVMIGSGIFISPQDALKFSGSVGACLLVWLICGIISLVGALCFAELGSVVPKSGAEYAYLMEAFGKKRNFWGPLPAFVCAWVYVLILRPAEIAIIILTFSKYSIQPFHTILGLENLSADQKSNLVKLFSLLTLGKLQYWISSINY